MQKKIFIDILFFTDILEIYGMKVTNCIVRDGLSWAEQPLINNDGCQIDEEIMGPFEYSKNVTEAHVTFPAHKFPFTSSVYYQCNIKLCLKQHGGCDDVVSNNQSSNIFFAEHFSLTFA